MLLPDNVILGSFLLVIFPFTFVVMHLYVLYYFFYTKSPTQYKAITVIEGADEDEGEEETGSNGEYLLGRL